MDSGACASVVRKETLDQALSAFGITHVEDSRTRQTSHKFGNYKQDWPSLFAVVIPFKFKDDDDKQSIGFNIHLDVIMGYLPFLLGF